MTSRTIRAVATAIALALIAPFAIFTASVASADDSQLIAPAPESSASTDTAYVYWSFFTADSKSDWKYSIQGPASVKPNEATFIGFRWGIGEGEAPRATTDFDKICAKTDTPEGKKLVAVAIDPGSPNPGNPSNVVESCVPVADDANALQTLQAASQVRLGDDNAMICGINGFPTSGCSYPASENPALAADSSTDSPAAVVTEQSDSNSAGSIVPMLIIAGIVVVVIAFIATLIRSRNKSSDQQ